MKFQKGLLDDPEQVQRPQPEVDREPDVPPPSSQSARDDQDHLFETHVRAASSWRRYLGLLAIVAVFVVIAGGAVFYLTLPKYGDQVRAPRGLEAAMRDHFLEVEKRTAEDIEFYYCDTYYWARVGVEKRPDITTNPVYQIGRYTAHATGDSGSGWKITAAPVTSPEMEAVCQ